MFNKRHINQANW